MKHCERAAAGNDDSKLHRARTERFAMPKEST
jgi:hypothetical protein